jgi:hypothetical protein
MSNKKFLFIYLLGFLFAVSFSGELIFLSYKNFVEGNTLLYPSSNSDFIFEFRDYDDIFLWVKQSKENLSFINLSAKIYELKDHLHHFNSSRGLSYLIPGIFLFIFNEPIYFTCFINILFLALSFYLIFFISFFIYKENFFISLLITCIVILFSNRLLGGILNFYNFFEYYNNLVSFYSSTNLKRIPNVLINNVIIFGYFYVYIKNYLNFYKNIFLSLFFLFLISFISPIVVMVFGISHFLLSIYFYNNNKIDLKKFFKINFYLFLILLTFIFHIFNLKNINDDSLQSEQWLGNFIYDLEKICIPFLLSIFFFKYFKDKYPEIFILLSSFILYFCSFFYDRYLATKIVEEFMFLYSFISVLFLINLLKKNEISIINLSKYSFLIFINILYIFLKKNNQLIYYYFFFLAFVFCTVIFFKYYTRFTDYFLRIISFFSFCLLIIFSLNSSLYFKEQFVYFPQNQKDQKEFFKYLYKENNKERILITLDLGIMKNATIHSNSYVYFTNITTTNLNRSELYDRFFDILYLYGFTTSDLKTYIADIKSNTQLKLNEYRDLEVRNKSLILENLYHALYQDNFDKLSVINTIINNYDLYLINKKYFSLKEFNTCVISDVDKNLVKKNSFVNRLILEDKPFYVNDYLRAYNCSFSKKNY